MLSCSTCIGSAPFCTCLRRHLSSEAPIYTGNLYTGNPVDMLNVYGIGACDGTFSMSRWIGGDPFCLPGCIAPVGTPPFLFAREAPVFFHHLFFGEAATLCEVTSP